MWLGLAASKHADAKDDFLKMIEITHTNYFKRRQPIGRVVYQAGLSSRPNMHKGCLFNGKREPHEHDHRICQAARECIHAQEQWDEQARMAVDLWVLIARRGHGEIRGVNRDIRKKIAQYVWAGRVDWPTRPPPDNGEWYPQKKEKNKM